VLLTTAALGCGKDARGALSLAARDMKVSLVLGRAVAS
jgi:hypothetical protein